jgi:fatty-acyl-CoA synthase
MTVQHHDWIAHHANGRGDQVAMVDLATDRAVTYREFDDRIARLAAALRSQYGIGRGDRVAVLAHNAADIFEVQFACGRLAAVFVPMNWRLTVSELRFIVGDCAPKVLIHDPEFAEAAIELAAACGVDQLCTHGCVDSDYERLIASAHRLPVSEPTTYDDVATILYTSGTTGHPKGAIITYGMRFWQAINMAGPMVISQRSVCLTALPLFHVGGLDVYANPIFHFGGRVLVMRTYEPATALRLLSSAEAGINLFVGTPAHYQFMARLPEFATAAFSPDLLAGIAASPVPLPVLREWEMRGLPLQQLYGMTESCGGVMALDPEDRVRKAGSAGKAALHVDVRLVRVDGSDAPVGEMGEIWLRGPSITPGYWKNPEASAAAFSDGWLRTGDAAQMDDEGYFTIIDRWKDMYISGGENVYPAEVEDVLYRLDAIAEVAIIGVPDEMWGEVGRAIVVTKQDRALSEADIMLHCAAHLARYKLPRSIRFVEALPRNATGKVHKPTLRARFGAA